MPTHVSRCSAVGLLLYIESSLAVGVRHLVARRDQVKVSKCGVSRRRTDATALKWDCGDDRSAKPGTLRHVDASPDALTAKLAARLQNLALVVSICSADSTILGQPGVHQAHQQPIMHLQMHPLTSSHGDSRPIEAANFFYCLAGSPWKRQMVVMVSALRGGLPPDRVKSPRCRTLRLRRSLVGCSGTRRRTGNSVQHDPGARCPIFLGKSL